LDLTFLKRFLKGSMSFNRFLDQAKEAASKAKVVSVEAAQALKESGSKLAEGSQEKAQETLAYLLQELNGLIPILRECGYSVGDLAFTISLPPQLKVVVAQDGKGSKSLETILAEKENELSKIQTATLRGLVKAYEFDQTVAQYGYHLGDIELVLSIPPQVTLNLSSNPALTAP
jgi:hypothetical protein